MDAGGKACSIYQNHIQTLWQHSRDPFFLPLVSLFKLFIHIVLTLRFTMGGSEPPYLYDAPKHRPVSYPYSNFDPKQVSRESWQRAVESTRPKSTQSGPLIDFNRHPDSYMIVAGTQINHKELPSNTKKAVTAVRWTQFSLRIIELLVAMGSLFCAIVLKPTDLTQAWIMRIIVSPFSRFKIGLTSDDSLDMISCSLRMLSTICFVRPKLAHHQAVPATISSLC